ncbi:nucleophile aminohydrolase [Cristinia sonorae]|uniref:Nucleophile aminohydrolase n=1 Tax=Cristinia sonorae TaxID=1940300 RepID=A0A8K0UZM5_9AGAR|nr:nucleophile aminohydrolase [Cristinia sonorae]
MVDFSSFYLIAVHGGAGSHAKSEDSVREIKHALRLACKLGLDNLKRGECCLTACEQAITVLEDESCLNAGYGSNLTLEGTVECDAALMDGAAGDFGAVGAVSGVKNPVKVARAILEHGRTVDVLGRVPPLMLVSHGAQNFALRRDIECVVPGAMVSERSRREWVIWKSRLDTALASRHRPARLEEESSGLHAVQDTVGAISWDSGSSLAAGVSSGGLLLKDAGRVGEAAYHGAGCWAQNTTSRKCGVACSVSGTGEYIIRCLVAKRISEAVVTSSEDQTHEALERVLGQFHDMCLAHGNNDPNVGVLVLTQSRDEHGMTQPRLWCAFTSESMSVGYASSLDAKPKTMIIRRPPESKPRTQHSIYISNLPLTRF